MTTDFTFYRNTPRNRIAVSIDDGDTVFLPTGRRAALDSAVWTVAVDVDVADVSPDCMRAVGSAVVAADAAADARVAARENELARVAAHTVAVAAHHAAVRAARMAWESSPAGIAHNARVRAFYVAVIAACRTV